MYIYEGYERKEYDYLPATNDAPLFIFLQEDISHDEV